MPGSRGRSFRRQRTTHQLSLRLAQTFASSGSTWPPSDVNALVQLISLPAPTLAMLPKRDSGPLLLSSVSASDAPPALARRGSASIGGDAPCGGVFDAELLGTVLGDDVAAERAHELEGAPWPDDDPEADADA